MNNATPTPATSLKPGDLAKIPFPAGYAVTVVRSVRPIGRMAIITIDVYRDGDKLIDVIVEAPAGEVGA